MITHKKEKAVDFSHTVDSSGIYGIPDGIGQNKADIKDDLNSPLARGLEIKTENYYRLKELTGYLENNCVKLGIKIAYDFDVKDRSPECSTFIERDHELFTDQRDLLLYTEYLVNELTKFTSF